MKPLFKFALFAPLSLVACQLFADDSFSPGSGQVTPVAVMVSSPLNHFSQQLSLQMLAFACAGGFPGGTIDGVDYGKCPDFNSQSTPFNESNFLSGFIYTSLLSVPFSMTNSSLYQVSASSDASITVESLTTPPSILLNYQNPDSSLASLTNSIYSPDNNNGTSFWSSEYDFGLYAATNSTTAENSISNTLDTTATALLAASSTDQTNYLSTPTATATFNNLVSPFACILSSNTDINCISDMNFPFILKGAIGGVYNFSGDSGVTVSDTTQNFISVSNLATYLSQSSTQLQALTTVNADTFMSPLMYKANLSTEPSDISSLPSYSNAANELEASDAYIKYVTGYYTPLPPISSSDFNAASLDNIFLYLAMQRTFAARQSMATSSLNYLQAQRVQPLNDDEPKISQKAYEHNMATRRMQTSSSGSTATGNCQDDPSGENCPTTWIQQINGMTPKRQTVEMMQMMAEIEYLLYKQTELLERLLAVEAVSLSNTVGMTKTGLTLDSVSDTACIYATGESCSSSSDSSS